VSDTPGVHKTFEDMKAALGKIPARFWFCIQCMTCHEARPRRCEACGGSVAGARPRRSDKPLGRPKGTTKKALAARALASEKAQKKKKTKPGK